MDELEGRQEFRAELHFHTELQTREAAAYEDRAVNFSMMVIKTGMVLNGGAVAALTPLVVALGADLNASFEWLLASLISFAVGLVLSWLGGAAGYFTVVQRGVIAQQDLLLIQHQLYSQFANLIAIQNRKAVEMAAMDINEDKEHAVFRRWRYAAIFLVVAGFVSFLVGVALSVFLLFDLTEVPPIVSDVG